MSKPFRIGSAISIAAVASIIAGCALPQSHLAGAGFGGKANENIGLATRAMAALNSNDIPAAINFAERAVAKTPSDAGFRALLGNAYFAAGRFVSAEGAYKDSLTLYSNQPKVVLKLALVEIALGKQGEALQFLNAAKDVLDPSDYGLAVALAGQPADAIPVLQAAARDPSADSRVRQNLALAYALAGDWTNARAVAAQDVPADQLDARIHQWMQLATPKRPSDQIASLIGVTPAATDPGEPVQFALNKSYARQAEAEAKAQPVPAPAPVKAPEPQVAQIVASSPPPFQLAEAPPAPIAPEAAPAPAPKLAPAPRRLSKRALEALEKPRKAQRNSKASAKPEFREAAVRRGDSKAVVQLGAYSNPKSILAAWNIASHRFGALRNYSPMSARFASSRGTFYRLSVHGFGSVNEAIALCSSLRHEGASCFVRNVAGDAPVQIAMR